MGTQEAISRIIRLVGGPENINKVWHCMTRLRFDLVDDNKIAQDEIKQLPGVLGAQLQSDQFQIIIGPKVNGWYELLQDTLGAGDKTAASGKKKNGKAWCRCLWIPSPACLARLFPPLRVPV